MARALRPSAANSPTPYTRPNLHGHVVHELGRRIVGGDYRPDSGLANEEALCREFGVSRTALREATKVLAGKGLLEARPRIGTRVRPAACWNMLDPDVLAWHCAAQPDADFMRQLAEVREIIEPNAAALAARNRDVTQLDTLERAYQAMAEAGSIEDWVTSDLAFHTAILDATNNALLAPLAAVIGSALEALLGLSARNAGDFALALPDHDRVRKAIRQQDASAAFHAMSCMLIDTRRRLLPERQAELESVVADGATEGK